MALLKRKASEPAVEAFVLARQLEAFDLLMEDLDTEYGTAWAALTLDTAKARIGAVTNAGGTELLVMAVDREDEEIGLEPLVEVIGFAKNNGLPVILVVDELSPSGVHKLIRAGADDFTPYPLPEGVLSDTIRAIRSQMAENGASSRINSASANARTRKKQGLLMPVHGISGGVGASTFAVNLAWEMAVALRKTDKRVAILDLDLQYGSVSTYLELPRREAIFELISAPEKMDQSAVEQATQVVRNRLDVLTAPPEAMPYEFLERSTVGKLLDILTSTHDFVIVDMPTTLTSWSDLLLQRAETYFAVMEMDMRSADNMLRFLRALKAEELPFEKIQYVLNRAPTSFTESARKTRMKKLAETLGIEFNVALPDGGKAVTDANDHGTPLAETIPRNPLRKDIRKTATSLIELIATQQDAAL